MAVDVYPTSVLNATLWNGQSMPLSISGGGTGATTAATARNNLGLGTMAEQHANAVAITGGSATLNTLIASGDITGQQNVNARQHTVSDTAGSPLTAFNSNLSVGSGRWQLFMQGSAANYIQGNIVLGTTDVSNNAKVFMLFDKPTSHGLIIQNYGDDTSGNSSIVFRNTAAAVVGYIIANATSTTYATSSDARLKSDIAPLTGALERIISLNPIRFLWKSTGEEGHGFAAHELQQVVPEAVTGEPDALNEDGSIKPQQVDFSKLVPWLVGALQELSARIKVLEGARV